MTEHHRPIAIDEFLIGASTNGPMIGLANRTLYADNAFEVLAPHLPTGCETRIVDGSALTTLPRLYDEFARIWDFPDYFGRNADAFDECMRSLDDYALDAGRPLPTGYLTVITDAHDVLPTGEELAQFITALAFYREHYRDVADPPATFAVLLSAPRSERRATDSRWRQARATHQGLVSPGPVAIPW